MSLAATRPLEQLFCSNQFLFVAANLLYKMRPHNDINEPVIVTFMSMLFDLRLAVLASEKKYTARRETVMVFNQLLSFGKIETRRS